MAFVINPDGTIKILEVKYDRSGNISPKRIIEGYENTALQQSHRDTEWHGGGWSRGFIFLTQRHRVARRKLVPRIYFPHTEAQSHTDRIVSYHFSVRSFKI